MPIFRRKSEVVEEVPELERYYAERRTSSAWSWLMALVTMILTILIIIGLFFGGRWIYRELISNDNASAPTVNTPTQATAETANPATASGAATLPAGESSEGQPANGGSQAPVPVTSSTNSTAPSPNTNTSAALPNSGPGTTILAALAAAFSAYLLSLYKFSKKRI